MASECDLKKANAWSLVLFKKLSQEKKRENIFISPSSISSSLAMVKMGARGNTATQMAKTLELTELENPKMSRRPIQSLLHSREQNRRQIMENKMMPRSRLPGYLCKMVAKMETEKDDDKTSQEDDKSGEVDAQVSQQDTKTSENDAQTGDEGSQNDQDDAHDKFAELLRELEESGDLCVATRLFGEKTCDFIKDYLEEIKKHYKAELESVDFKSEAEKVRTDINSWVEKQTQDKIKDMLSEGSVNASSKLVLVNGIYFKGRWESKFVEDGTMEFKVDKEKNKSVKIMQQKNNLRLMTENEIKILELPYQGEELSMIIVLPEDETGLEKLEKELTSEQLMEWTDALEKTAKMEVTVKLPRFDLEESYNLEKPLTSMGTIDAFDAVKSDFSGMSPAKDVVLSTVVHTAVMKVDEEECSAATSKDDSDSSSSNSTADFIADHPFVFFILHKPMKTILFSGRFCCPQ